MRPSFYDNQRCLENKQHTVGHEAKYILSSYDYLMFPRKEITYKACPLKPCITINKVQTKNKTFCSEYQ